MPTDEKLIPASMWWRRWTRPLYCDTGQPAVTPAQDSPAKPAWYYILDAQAPDYPVAGFDKPETIGWHDLDLTRYAVLLGTFVFSAEAIMYPAELIRTRLQNDRVTSTFPR